MKKSLVALAVSSAAFASISAQAAEDTTVGFYGNIQYVYVTKKDNHADSKSAFEDNGSSFGFKGQSKVGDSSTAFFNVKYKIHADEKDTDAAVKMDKAYVGVKGDFGTLEAGAFGELYSAITDPYDQFEYLSITNGMKTSKGDSVAYFTPTMSGIQLKVSAQKIGNGDDPSSTSSLSGENHGTSVAGVLSYTSGIITVALAHDSLNNIKTRTVKVGTEKHSVNYDGNGSTGVSVTIAPVEKLTISAKYEETDKVMKTIGLAARCSYGMGDLYGTYQRIDWDKSTANSETKNNEYGLGVTYNINSSMYVYAEVGQQGNLNKTKASAIGVTYTF